MRVIEQRLWRILACADQHDLTGGLVGRGQHRRAIDQVARHVAAGKRVAHDHAVAVRHHFGRAARTFFAILPGDADMGVDIGGDPTCGAATFAGSATSFCAS